MRRSNEARIYGPYKHGTVWRNHVVRRSGGKRTTAYDVYPTRELAEAALSGARSQAQGTTVKQAVDALLAQMRTAGNGDGTIETAEYRLAHFFGLPKNADRPLRWLNTRGAELYAAAQVERSADTHQAELGLAKQLGEMCLKRRWLRVDPFAGVAAVGRKTHGSSKPRLRVDESRKLLAYCHSLGNDQHAIITLAYLLLGSRASELVKRDVRDLDDGGRLLWINRTKTAAGTRRLLIPDELRMLLLRLAKGRAPDAPLFVTDSGERATRHWAYRHVRRICKAAGVPVVSPQALRRTQTDMATDAGETALAVSRHLGHASTAVTDRSYRDRNVASDAKNERAFRVIAGGRK